MKSRIRKFCNGLRSILLCKLIHWNAKNMYDCFDLSFTTSPHLASPCPGFRPHKLYPEKASTMAVKEIRNTFKRFHWILRCREPCRKLWFIKRFLFFLTPPPSLSLSLLWTMQWSSGIFMATLSTPIRYPSSQCFSYFSSPIIIMLIALYYSTTWK